MKLNPHKVTLFLFSIIICACIVNSTVLRAPGAANASPCEKSCDSNLNNSFFYISKLK